MTGERPHPHPSIDWGCPECSSTDITVLDRGTTRGHMKPPGYCYGCGIRFTTPQEIEE